MVANTRWRDVLRNSGGDAWHIAEVERLVDAEITILHEAMKRAQDANVECMENWLEWSESLLLELAGMAAMLRKAGGNA